MFISEDYYIHQSRNNGPAEIRSKFERKYAWVLLHKGKSVDTNGGKPHCAAVKRDVRETRSCGSFWYFCWGSKSLSTVEEQKIKSSILRIGFYFCEL